MKSLRSIVLAFTVALCCACAAQKNVVYMQDSAESEVSVEVAPDPVRIVPGDKLVIIVNTQNIHLMNQFNLPYVTRYLGATSDDVNTTSQGAVCYVVDNGGCIDFPVLGQIQVGGLTRDELASRIRTELRSQDLVRDPVVTVHFMNACVSVLGEVVRPGRYSLNRDTMTLLDAIALAGDLTINGRRDNVRVIRTENGIQKTYLVDLRDTRSLSTSPVYYVDQNDIIYVEPNLMRTRQSTVNGNTFTSTSFWISVASLTATIMSSLYLIFLTKK